MQFHLYLRRGRVTDAIEALTYSAPPTATPLGACTRQTRARARTRRAAPPAAAQNATAPAQGTFGEAELTPEEMQSLCAQYTKTYDGQIPPMWKAAFDGNLPAMKALHFFYRKGVDGFDAMNREDRSMPTHIACLRGHHAVLEWLAGLHWHDGRLVTNFNLRDDGGHTPLWLCAAWGWEKCVRLLLTLPHVHPLVPDAQGVSPEEAARRVGFHQVRRPASAEPSSSSRLDGVGARSSRIPARRSPTPSRSARRSSAWRCRSARSGTSPTSASTSRSPRPRRPRRSPTTRRTWSECVVAVPNPRPW